MELEAQRAFVEQMHEAISEATGASPKGGWGVRVAGARPRAGTRRARVDVRLGTAADAETVLEADAVVLVTTSIPSTTSSMPWKAESWFCIE